ncbi:MAG: amylo-alpha-1,6-glucosidase, partial [Lentisphaerota bacterium]
ISEAEGKKHEKPDKIVRQSAQAIAFEVLCRKNRSNVICDLKPKELALKLLDDPYEFVSSFYDPMEETPVVIWEWPTDMRRTLMIPPGHHILVKSPFRFRAKITGDRKIIVQRDSLKESSGKYFALFMPLPVTRNHVGLKMKISVYADDKSRREEAEILLLSPDDTRVHSTYSNADIRSSPLVFLDTNGRGGMLHTCVQWGELKSRYDALLAANLSVNYPEDRHIMWRRCRMWIDFHGRREVFSLDTVENFIVNTDGSGTWNFHLPVGNGLFADVSVNMLMIENENAVRIEILRRLASSEGEYLSDDLPVRIIVRPDIEDRNFHAETKAMYGAETHFPQSVETNHKAMTFAPSTGRSLVISTYKGKFVTAPEWQYSVYHEKEASRGLEAFSDLFSPGYFEITLDGGEGEQIIGQVLTPLENRKIQLNNVNHESLPADSSFEKVLFSAMDKFIVRRDGLKTVIAGYPWFLDWGRDTLICARGLIAAGKIDEVSQILLLFSKFEERGTLPNTIQGALAGNRDTSDAPLWLFVACSDFIRKTGRKDFLETAVEGRGALVSILESIAHNYIKGTSNGIIADKDSGLIFSPSHFTWMDTNYPAGTPREGYPVEIQALWYFALSFLAENTDKKEWKLLADKVRNSFMKLFYLEHGK